MSRSGCCSCRILCWTLVLQKLDPCSRASTAASCNKLSHAIPASTTLSVRCRDRETFNSLNLWLQHSTMVSLANLTEFSLDVDAPWAWRIPWHPIDLGYLPCAQLRELQLCGQAQLTVQLERAGDCPGLLHDCTSLTALDLQNFVVQDVPAAFAAIAALPELQHLVLFYVTDGQRVTDGQPLFGELQYPLQLTHLKIFHDANGGVPYSPEHLRQLSALVNLKHLYLGDLTMGLPGGLPSQLVKLTFLHLIFFGYEGDVAEQLRSLSGLTALQELFLEGSTLDIAAVMPAIVHLSKLSSLSFLSDEYLEFSTSSTGGLASLTALARLSLERCRVQPAAITALTQLRALGWQDVKPLGDATAEELLLAVSQLSLLTDVKYVDRIYNNQAMVPPAAAFAALTASTNLCAIHVECQRTDGLTDKLLFKPGPVYPHLRSIQLRGLKSTDAPVSEQQLQQLCSCCPAVETLAFKLCANASSTACLPLLQLSALTQLHVSLNGGTAAAAAAAAAVIDVAAQLTRLKQLKLEAPDLLDSTSMLQLTALTALEELGLTWAAWDEGYQYKISIRSKARCCNPPDVWIQLLRHLLCDAACRQALLRRSPAAAAAPAELMLAQLAATLAEELAAAG